MMVWRVSMTYKNLVVKGLTAGIMWLSWKAVTAKYVVCGSLKVYVLTA